MSQDTINLLTLLIAIWGAVLSSILGVRELVRDRRKVKVISSFHLIGLSPHDTELEECVEVMAFNSGHRLVEITSAGFELTNNTNLTYWRDPFSKVPTLPASLQDGESVTALFLVSQLEKSLRMTEDGVRYKSVFVLDSQGKRHRTDPPDILVIKKLALKRSLWKRLMRKW